MCDRGEFITLTRFVEHHFCSECRQPFRTNKQLKMHFGNKHKDDNPWGADGTPHEGDDSG